MDRTSDKQWLHDICHVGMLMGQSCQRIQRNQGTHRKLFSEFPTDSSRSTKRGYISNIPLLPSHINKKFMFVLCRKCAETENKSICNHSVGDRSLSGTWVSVEFQKAVQIGYTLLNVFEVRQYDTVTQYDPSTGDGGLFAQYMNTFIKIKMEASGYPSHCDPDQEKTSTLNVYEPTKGLLCVHMIFH